LRHVHSHCPQLFPCSNVFLLDLPVPQFIPRPFMRHLACCSLLLVFVAGCGPKASPFPTARVSGAITLDGAPIESGSINFMPEGASQSRPTATEFKSGQYELADAPIGKVRVTINSSRPTGKMVPGSSEPIPELENIIPEAYRQGIVVDIAGDNDKLDFALTKAGGPT
jgi:hypothetical protein